MKIVFLSRYQNRVSRGAETFVFELVKRLSEDFQVDILVDKDADDISKIVKGRYDIVIPMNGRLQSLKSSLGRILGGYKLIITGQSGIGRDEIWNIAVARPDVFVALTNHMAAWAKNWGWGSKVVKISNGVDLEKFNPSGEKIDFGLQRPIVLSVGALEWYKHHEKIIAAMAKTKAGSLLIVGKGNKKNELEQLGNKLLGDRVKIISTDYGDMPKVYRSCDLFTLPSWDREAFGIVYLEALSSGLGVVAPNDRSRREIIEDSGLFTNVDNEEGYAEAIKKALKIDWSKKARSQAEKFSWDKIAKEYKELFYP